MSIIGNVLFMSQGRASVSDLVRHLGEQLGKQVDDYDQRKFDAKSNEEVVEALSQDLKIDPLQVDYENGDNSADEISLSVHDVFGGQGKVAGLRVTKSIPFTGDANLWTWGTGQWGSMMPRGDVRANKIVIGIEVRANATEDAVTHITSTIEEIKRYVALQYDVLNVFNSALPSRLLPLVEARRSRRGEAASLLGRF
jgi:hypothetical protein